MIDDPRVVFTCRSSTLAVFVDLARFMDYYSPFWGQPRVRLRVGHQHSQFLSILVYFVHYYSAFWGPRTIFMIDEPRVVFTCPSSALTVLANSGPFHGLLLTVFRFQSDFHRCRTPRCAYVSVINNHSLGRFWPISWTITHRFGLPK